MHVKLLISRMFRGQGGTDIQDLIFPCRPHKLQPMNICIIIIEIFESHPVLLFKAVQILLKVKGYILYNEFLSQIILQINQTFYFGL